MRGGVTENRVSLRNIADKGFLRKIWKDHVRPMVRSMTFSQINLAPDALHYAAYEWGIKTLVSSLADDILRGRYSPERGEIVRSAKGKGLTRPLCFLAPRDALVYSAITALCKAQLISGARPWVGVEHGDKGQGKIPDGAADSFDWFRFWLEREGHILKMLDDPNVEYLVESAVMRWQMSLESLGLYPNGAKTGVIEKDKYLHDAMVAVNAEIEKIDHGLDDCIQGDPREALPTPELTEAIEEVSSAHRALEDRPIRRIRERSRSPGAAAREPRRRAARRPRRRPRRDKARWRLRRCRRRRGFLLLASPGGGW
jgi:hypothetical protein